MTIPVKPLSKLFNRVFTTWPDRLNNGLLELVDMIGSQYPDKAAARIRTGDQLWDAMRGYLAQGADLDAVDKFGNTLFTKVCDKGYADVVAKMIAEGARVNVPSGDYGYTPLMRAALQANYPMMKVLVDAGADVSARTFDGWSVLGIVLDNDGKGPREKTQAGRDCLKLLQDHGAKLGPYERKQTAATPVAAP